MQPATRPVRRASARAVAACLLLVALAGAACGSDRGESAGPAAFESTGAPWWERGQVRWSGQSAPVDAEDRVWSLSTTLDAAVFLHDRSDPVYTGDAIFVAPGAGTVTALFADGTVVDLATEVVGVPLADPTGHVVAWTKLSGPAAGEVTAYDTERREMLGTRPLTLDRDFGGSLTAVIGEKVYFSSEGSPHAWTPGKGEPAAVAGADGETHWVIGRKGSGLLGWSSGELQAIPAVAGGPALAAAIGSASPDGRYLAFPDPDKEYTSRVLDLSSGERVAIPLAEGKQAYSAQWVADGTLVVAAVDGSKLADGWDDALSVTSFACSIDEGTCRELDGGPSSVGFLGAFDGSAYGQLMAAFEGYGS